MGTTEEDCDWFDADGNRLRTLAEWRADPPYTNAWGVGSKQWGFWCNYCALWHLHPAAEGPYFSECEGWPTGYRLKYQQPCDIEIDPGGPLVRHHTLQVRASLAPSPEAPTSLYRLFSTSGRLLYIGIAGNPGRRFEQHRKDKPWWGEVANIKLEHFPTREAAARAERSSIQTEAPAHNIVHAGGAKVSPTSPSEPKRAGLVGSYFHAEDERGWQGSVDAEPAPGTFLCQLYSWIDGCPTEQRLVSIADMTRWSFYADSETWRSRGGEIMRRAIEP